MTGSRTHTVAVQQIIVVVVDSIDVDFYESIRPGQELQPISGAQRLCIRFNESLTDGGQDGGSEEDGLGVGPLGGHHPCL